MIKVPIDRQEMRSIISELADKLKSKIDLNLKHAKKLCRERYGIETINGLQHKGGNMTVFQGQIACKLDFEVRFPMSVLITTKESINSTISENNDVRAEIDAIPKEVHDIPEELDDLEPDQIDDIPKNSASSYFLR